MRTIYKHQIEITDEQTVMIHGDSGFPVFLHAGLDPVGRPCLWVEQETTFELKPHTIYIVGTGKQMPLKAMVHVGSFVQGRFVWHVYR